MKIVANRRSLLAALTLAAQAVPSGSRLYKEVLANVLITADPNHSTLYATDMEVAIKSEFGAEVEEGGSVLAPANLLRSILRELPDDSVLLETNKQILKVRGQSSKHDVPTAPTGEFPALPAPKWDATVAVTPCILASHLKAVTTQADQADGKYAYGCVRFGIEPGLLSLFAMDGRAMGFAEMPVAEKCEAVALLQKKTARMICGLEGTDAASLSISQNWLSIEFGGSQITGRLSEGRLPPPRNIPALARFSKAFSTQIAPSQLQSLIRRTCVALPDAQVGPRLAMKSDKGSLLLECSVGGVQSDSQMPCAYEGELDMLLNWQYLLEGLGGFCLFGDEPVQIEGDPQWGLKLSRDSLTYVFGALEEKE